MGGVQTMLHNHRLAWTAMASSAVQEVLQLSKRSPILVRRLSARLVRFRAPKSTELPDVHVPINLTIKIVAAVSLLHLLFRRGLPHCNHGTGIDRISCH